MLRSYRHLISIEPWSYDFSCSEVELVERNRLFKGFIRIEGECLQLLPK
jgi:hypothetical protein